MYSIHVKTTAQHLTGMFVQMPCRYPRSQFHSMYTLVSTQERRAQEDNNKQTRILEHNFPKEIPPSSNHATIPIASELGYRVCNNYRSSLVAPPCHARWFYNKVRIKTRQRKYQSQRKFLINIMNRLFFLLSFAEPRMMQTINIGS